VPQRVVEWIEGPPQAVQLVSEDAAGSRPLRGYQARDPTPAAEAVPTIQARAQATVPPTPTGAAQAERGRIANTDGSGVVLRNSPNDADRSRAGLMDGASVNLLEQSGSDWVHVRADNGQSGWVPARYVVIG
jgi:hypothetical protein